VKWIKLYTEILMDPKMGRLTDRQHRTCINLFLLAGQQERDGAVGSAADIAWQLHISEQDLADDLDALADVGITEERDGEWYVARFMQRQERPPSDTPDAVTDRVQRFRSKQRNANETPMKRPCNDPVTPPCNAEKKRVEESREEESRPSSDKYADLPMPPQPPKDDDPELERLQGYDLPYTQAVKLIAGREALATAWMDYVDAHPAIPNRAAYLTTNIKAGKPPPSNGKGPPGTSPPRVTGLSEADLEWQREHERAKQKAARAGPAPPA
jgi:hypothetical protein